MPRCIIIAGPNGAGKTTLAREFLARDLGLVHFVNADLIASGLSVLKPELVALTAGRLLLSELDRLASLGEDFAFETTLSGLAYAARLRHWKELGYRINILYLRLSTPNLAMKRIAARVKQGGHDIKKKDVFRRFDRSWQNFQRIYKPLADEWVIYDNSGEMRVVVEKSK